MLYVANTNIRGTVANRLPIRLLHHYLGLYPRRPRIPRKDLFLFLGILGLLGASALAFPLEFHEFIGKQVGSSGLQASWDC